MIFVALIIRAWKSIQKSHLEGHMEDNAKGICKGNNNVCATIVDIIIEKRSTIQTTTRQIIQNALECSSSGYKRRSQAHAFDTTIRTASFYTHLYEMRRSTLHFSSTFHLYVLFFRINTTSAVLLAKKHYFSFTRNQHHQQHQPNFSETNRAVN